jgi:flavin-dependent dehydrogenase
VKHKVAVIGAGNVGASAALYIAERGLADVVLIDRAEMEGMPQGKALDMAQSAPLWHKGTRIEGATDLAAVKGAEVVVMTAGFPRKPGMSRTDLLKANADIIRPAAEAVKKHAPNATVVVDQSARRDGVAVLADHRLSQGARDRHGRHPRQRALPRVPRHGARGLGRRHPGDGARRPR